MEQVKIFHKIHLAHRALFRMVDSVLEEQFGVTAAQQAVLFFLEARGAATMGATAEAVGIKYSALSGLIDRMTAKDLVSRRSSQVDKRSFELMLTQKGEDVVARAKPFVAEANDKLLADITETDLAAFALFLEKLTERAEALTEQASQLRKQEND